MNSTAKKPVKLKITLCASERNGCWWGKYCKKAPGFRKNLPCVPQQTNCSYFIAHRAVMAPGSLSVATKTFNICFMLTKDTSFRKTSKKTCWSFQKLLLAPLAEAMTPSGMAAGSLLARLAQPHLGGAGWGDAGSVLCSCLHKENSACYELILS